MTLKGEPSLNCDCLPPLIEINVAIITAPSLRKSCSQLLCLRFANNNNNLFPVKLMFVKLKNEWSIWRMDGWVSVLTLIYSGFWVQMIEQLICFRIERLDEVFFWKCCALTNGGYFLWLILFWVFAMHKIRSHCIR